MADYTWGQDSGSISADPHYREELGLNRYTAPQIAELFEALDRLKPIPAQENGVEIKPFSTDNRAQYALSFGVLIADGFLAVENQNAQTIDSLGHELLARAKGLGVSQRMNRHGARLIALSRSRHWAELRQELVATQQDIEDAMLELRDEQLAHLLSLGGWIRGLEIGASCVIANYSATRAAELKRLDVLDYYLAQFGTMSPRLKKTALLQRLLAGLEELQTALHADLTPAQVLQLHELARSLLALIQGDSEHPGSH